MNESSTPTPHTVSGPNGVGVTVDLPGTWMEREVEDGIALVHETPWLQGFEDNLTFTWTPPLDVTLEQWARVSREMQNESLVDLTVLDEELTADLHRRSFLAVIPPGITAIWHERRTIRNGIGLTASFMTMPSADVIHAQEIDAALSSITRREEITP